MIHAFREIDFGICSMEFSVGVSEWFNHLEASLGGVSEWFKEAVLKTVVPQGTGGSNPSSSAR